MTITRKMDRCFMVLGHFMMVAFLMIGAACYNQGRQPDFNDFVNQKLIDYDKEKTKPVILTRTKRPHFFQYSKNEPDDVYGAIFALNERKRK